MCCMTVRHATCGPTGVVVPSPHGTPRCPVDCGKQKEPIPDASFLGPVSGGLPTRCPSSREFRKGWNTLKQRNNYSLCRDTRPGRIRHYLRERLARQGRIVYRQVLRGAAYSLGSGAVSVLILWFEARH